MTLSFTERHHSAIEKVAYAIIDLSSSGSVPFLDRQLTLITDKRRVSSVCGPERKNKKMLRFSNGNKNCRFFISIVFADRVEKIQPLLLQICGTSTHFDMQTLHSLSSALLRRSGVVVTSSSFFYPSVGSPSMMFSSKKLAIQLFYFNAFVPFV